MFDIGLLNKIALFVVVLTACLLLSTNIAIGDFFIYRRSDILSGEYWRLIGGNFVHLNMPHLLLNLVAWLLIWQYGLSACGNFVWWVLLLVCSLGTGVGLLFFSPEIEEYTGLSGALHGLFVAISVLRLLISRSDYSAWLILVVLAIKLVFEHFFGATTVTADWINLDILVEAHWYGFVSGALAVAVIYLYQRRGAVL